MSSMVHDLYDQQEQYIKRLGLDPRYTTEDQIAQKLSMNQEKTKGVECSICLESIEEDPFFPCYCLYFHVHEDCLPDQVTKCGQCKSCYLMKKKLNDKCIATTLLCTRCTRRKLIGDLCRTHNRIHENRMT